MIASTAPHDPRELCAHQARAAFLLRQPVHFMKHDSFPSLSESGHWRSVVSEVSETPTARLPSQMRLPAHIERLCGTPLLTPVEERTKFRDMNYLKFEAASRLQTLHPTRPSRRKVEQIDRLLAAAVCLRNEIVNANTRLVVSIVKKFASDSAQFDEMLSEGIQSLLNAVEKFDFDRGFRFSTYGTMAIRREIYRYIMRAERDRGRLSSGSTEHLIDEREPIDVYSPQERTQVGEHVAALMSQLDERERFIVGARFGFFDLDRKATFAHLGQQLGISKERARQLEMRAVEKLRRLLPTQRFARDLKNFAWR